MPLYPDEQQIARAVLGPDKIKDWPAIAAIDERKGLPHIDPLHGGRYWPAVRRFYDAINAIGAPEAAASAALQKRIRVVPFAPDGEEDFNGEKATALQNRRRGARASGAGT